MTPDKYSRTPDVLEPAMAYGPVRVYDAEGNLKRVIPAKALQERVTARERSASIAPKAAWAFPDGPPSRKKKGFAEEDDDL